MAVAVIVVVGMTQADFVIETAEAVAEGGVRERMRMMGIESCRKGIERCMVSALEFREGGDAELIVVSSKRMEALDVFGAVLYLLTYLTRWYVIAVVFEWYVLMSVL